MAEQSIEEFLAQDEAKGLLRFSTAGSIDDGKSTLIGRLLNDSRNVYDDHLSALKAASHQARDDNELELAFLTDGLRAEREQGITIDVAYRYFSTPKRKFIIADTPGHEQYTRNMATGASTANVAVVLIDARKGVLPQTKRHAFISSLLGVPHMVVAVNKMDLVDYDEKVFDRIRVDFEAFASRLQVSDLRFIPISALKGDNVVERSERMPWYKGESVMEILEDVYVSGDVNLVDFRFPVQYVSRPHLDFRGYCGQVASGVIRPGDEVMVLPSMTTSRVKSIVTFEGEQDIAFPPMSVTLTLEDELDISRGDMIVRRHNVPHVGRHFEAMMVWMGEKPLDANRSYWIKHTTRMTRARIDEVRYSVDVQSLARENADALELNDIGRVVLTATTPLAFDAYPKNRSTGGFILVDETDHGTVAAGMIIDREPESQLPARMQSGRALDGKVQKRESQVSTKERQERFGQKAVTLWMTGLAASGKSEIAYALERRLFDLGAACMVLDGVNMRLGVSRELGFGADERAEHLRRVGEVARLSNQSGLIAICDFVSPLASLREQVSGIVGETQFLEIFVDASAEWCAQQDATGLYERAKTGEITNLAGVNAVYEAPENAVLTVRPEDDSIDACVDKIVALLRDRGIFPGR
jgi:bifunctional enzyme CysN/CysC